MQEKLVILFKTWPTSFGATLNQLLDYPATRFVIKTGGYVGAEIPLHLDRLIASGLGVSGHRLHRSHDLYFWTKIHD